MRDWGAETPRPWRKAPADVIGAAVIVGKMATGDIGDAKPQPKGCRPNR